MLGWLGRLIYKNRHDNLFTAFATLPLVSQLAWFFSQGSIARYIPPDQMMSMFALNSAVSFALTGLSLGLFFVGRQRGTKWMGIFVSALSVIISQLMFVVAGFTAFPLTIFLLLSLIALIMVGVPAFFFWRDGQLKQKQPDDLTTEPTFS